MISEKLAFETPADNQEHDGSRLLSDDATPSNVRVNELYSNWLMPKELGLFARTCQKAEAETAFLRLLHVAVGAEPESYQQSDETKLAAIAILKRHPDLLFVKGMVTDHVGRKIFASPYQLLLGAGDVWALQQVHDDIIPIIKDGDILAQTQFKEQFPHCQQGFNPDLGEEQLYDDRNIAQVEQVKETLKSIVAAISMDPCTNGLATLPETGKTVKELCQLFTAKQGEVIKTGLHFPFAIMWEIFKVYDTQFNPWSGAQLSLYSRTVIGAAEAVLTVVDGQCCKYGLSNLDMNKGPDRRDGLFCRQPKGIPQELTPIRTKLGHEMFVDPYNGNSCFQTSSIGIFDWYNKNGRLGVGARSLFSCCKLGLQAPRCAKFMENKAGSYGKHYAATPRVVRTQSRSK